MRRGILLLGAGLALALVADKAVAGGAMSNRTYRPWSSIFEKRDANLTAEEERLQKFWRDYYDALKNYYAQLDHIDWVEHYKNHGFQINGACVGGNCQPVPVSPGTAARRWAMPNFPPPRTAARSAPAEVAALMRATAVVFPLGAR
jgi:hypothetical protein